MALNTELFKKIHDVISITPEQFDMAGWEDTDSGCGTTRCVAGWAIHFSLEGGNLYDGRGDHTDALIALAKKVGSKVTMDRQGYEYVDLETLGGKLLGLEAGQKGVFYVSEDRAAMFVELAAEGRDQDALDGLNNP